MEISGGSGFLGDEGGGPGAQNASGGRLNGYANDVGVQFEIMNTAVGDMHKDIKKQSEEAARQAALVDAQAEQTMALALAVEQMRVDTMVTMHQLNQRLGLSGGGKSAASLLAASSAKSLAANRAASSATHVVRPGAAKDPAANGEDRLQDGERVCVSDKPPSRYRTRHRHRSSNGQCTTYYSTHDASEPPSPDGHAALPNTANATSTSQRPPSNGHTREGAPPSGHGVPNDGRGASRRPSAEEAGAYDA
jgi:hypothetical protein